MKEENRVNLFLAGIVVFETVILGVILFKVYLGSSGFHFPLP